jgi:hypothetical protein
VNLFYIGLYTDIHYNLHVLMHSTAHAICSAHSTCTSCTQHANHEMAYAWIIKNTPVSPLNSFTVTTKSEARITNVRIGNQLLVLLWLHSMLLWIHHVIFTLNDAWLTWRTNLKLCTSIPQQQLVGLDPKLDKMWVNVSEVDYCLVEWVWCTM